MAVVAAGWERYVIFLSLLSFDIIFLFVPTITMSLSLLFQLNYLLYNPFITSYNYYETEPEPKYLQ